MSCALLRGWRRLGLALLVLWGALLGVMPAHAHLMAAQKGTLNLVGDAAFLVLSVPVSALLRVDDDRDGALSKAELAAHADAVRAQVLAGVQLLDAGGALPLQLVMLDTAPPDSTPTAAARQLVVLGRFQLPTRTGSAGEGLSLRLSLFGTEASEQQQDVTITRQQETQWLRFTPGRATQALLPSAAAVFGDYVRSGATHVLSGADHLLFLLVVLVVLSAGWHWRALLGALTCFTAGHALTLVACVWGGWSLPDRIVEPAIAATLVGMAAFDAWGRWRTPPARPGVRLALVFACALVHGLGLAGALADLSQWAPGSRAMLWALAGFNLGIEVAQVGVAVLAGLVVTALQGLVGPQVRQRARQFATLAVMAVGSLWFVERVVQAG
ncbi:HupE/UreJ family protein [Sphaerotilus montanus]|uniref:HupE/UreJ family protein n=1 Tax=Sphaerotilus montanus TaxID=522889 RepID=UPI003FA1DC18